MFDRGADLGPGGGLVVGPGDVEGPVNAGASTGGAGAGASRFTGDPLVFVLAATGRGALAPLGLDESANIYR